MGIVTNSRSPESRLPDNTRYAIAAMSWPFSLPPRDGVATRHGFSVGHQVVITAFCQHLPLCLELVRVLNHNPQIHVIKEFLHHRKIMWVCSPGAVGTDPEGRQGNIEAYHSIFRHDKARLGLKR